MSIRRGRGKFREPFGRENFRGVGCELDTPAERLLRAIFGDPSVFTDEPRRGYLHLPSWPFEHDDWTREGYGFKIWQTRKQRRQDRKAQLSPRATRSRR